MKTIATLALVILAGAAAAQNYVLEANVVDGGGRKLSSQGFACGLSVGQTVASGWITSSGYRAVLGFWNRPVSVIGIGEPGTGVRFEDGFSLAGCAPNPVRSRTAIRYSLGQESDVRLGLFDRAGREKGSIVRARQGPGAYRATWDISGVPEQELPNGVYFLRLVAGEHRAVTKAVVAR